MTPSAGGEADYQSKFWPSLNGPTDDVAALMALSMEPRSEREATLLDVIGAYDLLVLQGLTEQHAVIRLGLRKSRNELVQELDAETDRRLAKAGPHRAQISL